MYHLFFNFSLLLFHQLPDFPRYVAGLRDVCASQLGIAFGHLDVGVPKDLRQFIKIAAAHHVPRRKRVTEVVETEVLNLRSFEQVFKAVLYTLPSTSRTRLRRQIRSSPITAGHLRISIAGSGGIGTYRAKLLEEAAKIQQVMLLQRCGRLQIFCDGCEVSYIPVSYIASNR